MAFSTHPHSDTVADAPALSASAMNPALRGLMVIGAVIRNLAYRAEWPLFIPRQVPELIPLAVGKPVACQATMDGPLSFTKFPLVRRQGCYFQALRGRTSGETLIGDSSVAFQEQGGPLGIFRA
jgi:hypothetical protein